MINIWISFFLVGFSFVLVGYCFLKKDNFLDINSYKGFDSVFKWKEINVLFWKILLILINYILWVFKVSWCRGNKYLLVIIEYWLIRR